MQNPHSESILADLLQHLEDIDQSYKNDLNLTLICAERAASTLQALNRYILEKSLSGDEEIKIFKNIKPQIEGRLYFYLELLKVQQLIPVSSEKDRWAYFQQRQLKLQIWLQRNADLHSYFRLGLTHRDELYFRRGEPVPPSPDNFRLSAAGGLQTLHSRDMALYISAELMQTYIQSQLIQGNTTSAEPGQSTIALTWTGSQAELTELVYALNEMGVFGGIRHPIQTLKTFFENAFNANLGNIYKTYEHNRLRKKSRTPFLDSARMALLRRYDHDDEHAL